ncbi:hypothetical protein C2845_PM01G31390 [Panicum miliaceum]|uniref:Uncharacterized protein n=1 Tax=Panicum miliaceum TaxID=4540 RepID=A0A3L6TQ83_PANMI|nr:hypothetical protein C2845_PM01G31390 [Panicum miliaceum]
MSDPQQSEEEVNLEPDEMYLVMQLNTAELWKEERTKVWHIRATSEQAQSSHVSLHTHQNIHPAGSWVACARRHAGQSGRRGATGGRRGGAPGGATGGEAARQADGRHKELVGCRSAASMRSLMAAAGSSRSTVRDAPVPLLTLERWGRLEEHGDPAAAALGVLTCLDSRHWEVAGICTIVSKKRELQKQGKSAFILDASEKMYALLELFLPHFILTLCSSLICLCSDIDVFPHL